MTIPDIEQIIYALERAVADNQRLANELHEAHDYRAEIPAMDAELIQEAINLLKGE